MNCTLAHLGERLNEGTAMGSDRSTRVVMDSDEIDRAITRMAHQILEADHAATSLVLVGIATRGVPLAYRLAAAIQAARDCGPVPAGSIPVGELDITLYRDDLRRRPTRAVGPTRVPVSLDDATVVLVDDVLFSGRTIRAALDAVSDLGRPRAIRLAVLIDRGHRQLPIRADHVGKNLPTAASEQVLVRLSETDGVSEVAIQPGEATSHREQTGEVANHQEQAREATNLQDQAREVTNHPGHI